MPYITEYQPAELFMEHAGVAIYHVYEDNLIDQGARSQRFATHENGDDGERHGRNGVFDIECLPEPPTPPRLGDHPPFVGVEHGREAGFENYEDWKDSAEYARRRALWDNWHESGEAEAIRNTIRHAIDVGLITADGVALEPAGKKHEA